MEAVRDQSRDPPAEKAMAVCVPAAIVTRRVGDSVSAWAVVNGRAYVLVTNGIWAGAWLPEEVVLAYER